MSSELFPFLGNGSSGTLILSALTSIFCDNGNWPASPLKQYNKAHITGSFGHGLKDCQLYATICL